MLQNGQDPNNEGNSINRINPHRVTGSNGQLYAMDWTEYLELSVLKRPFDQDSPFKSCVGSTAAPSGRLCYYHPWPTCGRWSRWHLWGKAGETTVQLAIKQSSTDRPGNLVLNPWCICCTHQWKLGVAEWARWINQGMEQCGRHHPAGLINVLSITIQLQNMCPTE